MAGIAIFKPQIKLQNLENFVDKGKFEEALKKLFSSRSDNTKPQWTAARVRKVIRIIEEFKEAQTLNIKKSNAQYFYARNYDVVETEGKKILFSKIKNDSDKILRIVPTEEYYEHISYCHLITGHGGRDKIIQELRTKIKCKIPTAAIQVYLSLCTRCIKKKAPKKIPVRKFDALTNMCYSRAQFDIIDYQTLSDKQHKWLLIYSDHKTEFTFLRPMFTSEEAEVASELFKIFMEYGYPSIVQGYDRDYLMKVLQELRRIWPKCPILIGRHFRRDNWGQEISDRMENWMTQNKSTSWTIGCNFVQYEINTKRHKNILITPYRAMFGNDPMIGVPSTMLPSTWRGEVRTEEDLEKAISLMKFEPSTSQAVDKESIHYEFIVKDEPEDVIDQDDVKVLLCCVCQEECSGEHKCWKCEREIHKKCGDISNIDIGFGSSLICNWCLLGEVKEEIKEERDDDS